MVILCVSNYVSCSNILVSWNLVDRFQSRQNVEISPRIDSAWSVIRRFTCSFAGRWDSSRAWCGPWSAGSARGWPIIMRRGTRVVRRTTDCLSSCVHTYVVTASALALFPNLKLNQKASVLFLFFLPSIVANVLARFGGSHDHWLKYPKNSIASSTGASSRTAFYDRASCPWLDILYLREVSKYGSVVCIFFHPLSERFCTGDVSRAQRSIASSYRRTWWKNLQWEVVRSSRYFVQRAKNQLQLFSLISQRTSYLPLLVT
jgi:hypothetical protein